MDADFAENHNIAEGNRSKLIEMIATWYVEAGKYHVLPVDGRGVQRYADERPQLTKNRTHYTFYPHTQAVPYNAGAITLNRTHSITADVEIPSGGAEGLSFLLEAWMAAIRSTCKMANSIRSKLRGSRLSAGGEHRPDPGQRHDLRFEFEVTGPPDFANGKGTPGRAQLYIDGKLVGQADFPHTTPFTLGLTGAMIVGADPGAPVRRSTSRPLVHRTIHR